MPTMHALQSANPPVSSLVGRMNLNQVEQEGRDHARRGIFHPPFHRLNWRHEEPDRAAAQDAYSRAYWSEYERLRFARGEYDLL